MNINSQLTRHIRFRPHQTALTIILSACLSLLFAFHCSKTTAQIIQGRRGQVSVSSYEKKTIFYSYPQRCGNGLEECRSSEWTGTWIMPDGSLMVAFTHATGPTSPALGRTFMPENLLNLFKLSDGRRFTHIRPAPPGYYYFEKGYDYYGLSGNCPPLRSFRPLRNAPRWFI